MSISTGKFLPDLHLKRNSLARLSITRHLAMMKRNKELNIMASDSVVFSPAYPVYKAITRGTKDLVNRISYSSTVQITRENGEVDVVLTTFDKPSISEIYFGNEFSRTLLSNIERSIIVNNTPISNTMDLVRLLITDDFMHEGLRYQLSAIDFVMEIYALEQKTYTLYARSDSTDVSGSIYIERDEARLHIRPLT